LSKRVDPLVTELVNNVQSTGNPAIKTDILSALTGVLSVKATGDKVSEEVILNAKDELFVLLDDEKDSVRRGAASAVGVICQYVDEDEFDSIILDMLEDDGDWREKEGHGLTLSSILKTGKELSGEQLESVVKGVGDFLEADNTSVKRCAVKLLTSIIKYTLSVGEEETAQKMMAKLMETAVDEVEQIRVDTYVLLGDLLAETEIEDMKSMMHQIVPVCVGRSSDTLMIRDKSGRCLYHLFQYGKQGATPKVISWYCSDKRVSEKDATVLQGYLKRFVSKLGKKQSMCLDDDEKL